MDSANGRILRDAIKLAAQPQPRARGRIRTPVRPPVDPARSACTVNPPQVGTLTHRGRALILHHRGPGVLGRSGAVIRTPLGTRDLSCPHLGRTPHRADRPLDHDQTRAARVRGPVPWPVVPRRCGRWRRRRSGCASQETPRYGLVFPCIRPRRRAHRASDRPPPAPTPPTLRQ